MVHRMMLAVGLTTGVLMLGACASHSTDTGKTRAKMVTGAGNGNGSGKRICVRQPQNGTHIAQTYCMTPAQYKEYQKAQEQSQEMFQRNIETKSQTGGCKGPRC